MMLGSLVHYRSRGSADGAFPPECRAAIVTEENNHGGYATMNLCVLNPKGIFFDFNIEHSASMTPGSFHDPEECRE